MTHLPPPGPVLSTPERLSLHSTLLTTSSPSTDFIHALPKVELHIHIEGSLTPSLRWKLAHRNNIPVTLGQSTPILTSLSDLIAAMKTIQPHPTGDPKIDANEVGFFEAYYTAFQVLRTRQDFLELAMELFGRLAGMQVRYVEVFFDPQEHTRREVGWEGMMEGFREAAGRAERELNVKAKWIMCFLRDQGAESALEHYKAALPWRDMIVGVGLDSIEDDHPPLEFEEVFAMARGDGFRVTAHCDVGVKDSHEHIHEVVALLAGSGADRIDHGMHAVERPELMESILERNLGMTLCPWSYLRYRPHQEIGEKIRKLFDAGIRITINSDDPTYNDSDTWVLHNMLLARHLCGFSDKEMATLSRNAVEISWADQSVKDDILHDIDEVYNKFHPT